LALSLAALGPHLGQALASTYLFVCRSWLLLLLLPLLLRPQSVAVAVSCLQSCN
jgi:hypothetical protein